MANERARQLRKQATPAERRIWCKLRGLKERGFKFRQQVPIDHYIVDFACLSHRLIVEVDGVTHSTEEEVVYDLRRESYLRGQRFHVLRFWNDDIWRDLPSVMDTIVRTLEDIEESAQSDHARD